MIAYVVEKEGPVLDAVLTRRIARAHGWAKAGGRIRERVDRIVRSQFHFHEEEQTGTFWWPVQLEDKSRVIFSLPDEEGAMRSLGEICLPELAALVREMVDQGHEGETLIYAVAREAGFGRVAHAGRQRIEKAIQLASE